MKPIHYACKSEKVIYKDFLYVDVKLHVIKDVPFCNHCQRYIEEYDIMRPAMRMEEFSHIRK